MDRVNQLFWWADNHRKATANNQPRHWLRNWPFILLHLIFIYALTTSPSLFALGTAVLLYLVRMFAITAFYHRYFSHKTFKTSRTLQFIFACIGTAATQRGPLWWASHHRIHHKTSDTEDDPHSPLHGVWHSHCGWFLSGQHFSTPTERINDFSRFPELRWLDRFDMLIPIALIVGLWVMGTLLAQFAPGLGTNGIELVLWGYVVSTVLLTHATLLVNSLAHRWGSRRYETGDDSRNNWLIALLTLGEGWHNNHHHYSGSARQGFFWWEIDISYYVLRLMAALGLIWDLKPVPARKKWATKNTESSSSKPEQNP